MDLDLGQEAVFVSLRIIVRTPPTITAQLHAQRPETSVDEGQVPSQEPAASRSRSSTPTASTIDQVPGRWYTARGHRHLGLI